MTLPDLSTRANANLLATYLSVGRAFPGAHVHETEAYTTLLSDLPHPSGNFAARLRLDPWSAAELRTLGSSRPAFQAVALPDDGPAHLAELLRRAGFGPVHRLVSMVSPEPYTTKLGRSRLGEFGMLKCEEPGDRRIAGRFMADVFFARDPESLRRTMADAVVEAHELAIHVHALGDKIGAAVTLTRHEGMLGIYNLSVAPSHRGKGIGSSLVAWCLAQAADEGRPACLQCTPALEPWYQRHGFRRSGAVSVWALDVKARI